MLPDWLLQVLSMLAVAGGVYAGIHHDMGRMTAKIESHHERLAVIENKLFK